MRAALGLLACAAACAPGAAVRRSPKVWTPDELELLRGEAAWNRAVVTRLGAAGARLLAGPTSATRGSSPASRCTTSCG